jgi:aerotaxis receptor
MSMRSNLPVTATEYPIPADATIVSTTDLKGRITYCNPSFVEASGYSEQELLGKPHNMVRHPDMPEEAFRDLWATISGGRPWSAMVKNRRKNGDFYWVRANVTPLMDGDQPIGYMSVRICPTRDQVQAAERLYQRMRAEQDAGAPSVRLCHGQVQRLGRAATVLRWLTPSLPARVSLLALAGAAGGFGAGALAAAGPSGTMLAGGLASAALGLGLGAMARHWTTRPMQRLLHMAHRLAAGDLTQRIEAHGSGLAGELSGALNQVVLNLRAMVRDARVEVRRIEGAAGEVAAGGSDLSSRTESQAANLQQTAASVEQITATVRQSTDAAQQAAELAQQAHLITREGSSVVNGVTATMGEIARSSDRIAEITQVIDGISFQTNLLALNAAVEAARAGEQGRGFAVVAGEVRALAQRTSHAAREIKALIGSATSRVEQGSSRWRRRRPPWRRRWTRWPR